MAQSLSEKSKYLSYLLRHKPDAAFLTLDREGWCGLDQLLANTTLSLTEIKQIVATDEKGRYSFNENGTHIRANQGHSTSTVRMSFARAVPPTVLYHGTSDAALNIIQKEGLKPMSRHHVHLSADLGTAEIVGGRRKKGFTVLRVDAKSMLADGIEFFISENGVWLVDAVPAKYIKVHVAS